MIIRRQFVLVSKAELPHIPITHTFTVVYRILRVITLVIEPWFITTVSTLRSAIHTL